MKPYQTLPRVLMAQAFTFTHFEYPPPSTRFNVRHVENVAANVWNVVCNLQNVFFPQL